MHNFSNYINVVGDYALSSQIRHHSDHVEAL